VCHAGDSVVKCLESVNFTDADDDDDDDADFNIHTYRLCAGGLFKNNNNTGNVSLQRFNCLAARHLR